MSTQYARKLLGLTFILCVDPSVYLCVSRTHLCARVKQKKKWIYICLFFSLDRRIFKKWALIKLHFWTKVRRLIWMWYFKNNFLRKYREQFLCVFKKFYLHLYIVENYLSNYGQKTWFLAKFWKFLLKSLQNCVNLACYASFSARVFKLIWNRKILHFLQNLDQKTFRIWQCSQNLSYCANLFVWFLDQFCIYR